MNEQLTVVGLVIIGVLILVGVVLSLVFGLLFEGRHR